MYLSKKANVTTLQQTAALAPGSTFATTFLLPTELQDGDLRPGFEAAESGARAAGTPFISFYSPVEIVDLALRAGFRDALHVSAETLNQRYFAGRSDDLRVARGEELLVAST
jgi:O-methyltransferase involved in polyketide biosynthesis